MEVSQALAGMSMNEVHDPNWCSYTGATAHMIDDICTLASSIPYSCKDKIYIDNGAG